MVDDDTFLPAKSKAEAVARLYAVAGATPEPLGPGSTEKKSVLTAVASRFDLPVDRDARKEVLGGQIAHALGAAWSTRSWSRGSTITLLGLNTLLEAATHEIARTARRTSPFEQGLLDLLELDGFRPARSKLEAVNRISALTGSGPESLGPGSKERKSVLINLATNLAPHLSTGESKTRLGHALAQELGVGWTQASFSSGETITLTGLNALLAGAERRLGVLGRPVAETFTTPGAEADAILAVLADAISTCWDARECVEKMREADFAHWKQTEWIGWQLEFVGIPALVNAFGGGPRKVLNTSFDYGLRSTWDLKARSEGKGPSSPLNDLDAVHACLDEGGGLGFVVLSGTPDYSASTEFDSWHRRERGAGPAHERSRPLKSGFAPTTLDAFHLPDRAALDDATARGDYSTMQQGRQQSGSARKPKLQIKMQNATRPGGSHVAHRSLV